MKFNAFIWELYKNSEHGKNTIQKYSLLTEQFIDPWCRSFTADLRENEEDPAKEVSVNSVDFFKSGMLTLTFANLEEANRYFVDVLVAKGIPWKQSDEEEATNVGITPEAWYDYVGALSLGFHLAQPELFLPYNFRGEFNQLREIHEEFGIPLPNVPRPKDKEGRGAYYLLINQVWLEFRIRYGLSPAEMCAFLYEFATKFTTSEDARELPEPSRVWFVPCSQGDFDRVDKITADEILPWSGSPDVRRGDILMMYKFAPLTKIDSVWRACSDGGFDPFYDFAARVVLCGRVKTEPVTFSELRRHPLLGQKSAVRSNFQGNHSSAPITVEEYGAILKIMESKGQDTSLLPRIEILDYSAPGTLLRESDVEEQLVEAILLPQLGFKTGDWVRQMPLRMGRGERNYPDYAFGAVQKRGEESAELILEAKFQLSARKDLEEAFFQAKSYAYRLQAKIMALAAREGVWVFPPAPVNGNFDLKRFVRKSWAELRHRDHFHAILELIGRDKVLGKK